MGVVHLIIVYVPGVSLVVSKARGVKFAVSFFWVNGHIEIYPVLWWTLELRFNFSNLPYNMPYSVNADTQGIRIPLNADPGSKNTFNADKSGYYLFYSIYLLLYSKYSSFWMKASNNETGFSTVLATEEYSLEQPVLPGCLASYKLYLYLCYFSSQLRLIMVWLWNLLMLFITYFTDLFWILALKSYYNFW